MTDTPIDTAAGTEPTLDREALLEGTMRALARLEKMYDAARRKLRTAKTAEELVQQILEPKRTQLQRMFAIGLMPEDIADLFVQELAAKNVALSSTKLLKALRKFSESPAENSSVQAAGKKRDRKSNAEKAAAQAEVVTDEKFPENSTPPAPKNSKKIPRYFPRNQPLSLANL